MGPSTCSIASRWRSSGRKDAEREFDFVTDIAAQDITWKDEEGCAELGGLESRTISRQDGGPSPFAQGGSQPPGTAVANLPLGLPERCRRYCLPDLQSIPPSRYSARRIFGKATIPPNCSIVFAMLSRLSTSTEHTNAFVPVPRGGAGAGRFSKPPLDPPVSIRQQEMGRPLTSSNFRSKIWE